MTGQHSDAIDDGNDTSGHMPRTRFFHDQDVSEEDDSHEGRREHSDDDTTGHAEFFRVSEGAEGPEVERWDTTDDTADAGD